jgi:hypothetical protein
MVCELIFGKFLVDDQLIHLRLCLCRSWPSLRTVRGAGRGCRRRGSPSHAAPLKTGALGPLSGETLNKTGGSRARSQVRYTLRGPGSSPAIRLHTAPETTWVHSSACSQVIFLFFCTFTLFYICYSLRYASFAAPHIPLCRRMLGSNPGLLRLLHWPPDAPTTRLDLIHL